MLSSAAISLGQARGRLSFVRYSNERAHADQEEGASSSFERSLLQGTPLGSQKLEVLYLTQSPPLTASEESCCRVRPWNPSDEYETALVVSSQLVYSDETSLCAHKERELLEAIMM